MVKKNDESKSKSSHITGSSRFPPSLSVLSFGLGLKSLDQDWEKLGEESLLLCIKNGQLRWIGHLIKKPPRSLLLKVLWHDPLEGDLRANPKLAERIVFKRRLETPRVEACLTRRSVRLKT